VKKIIHVLGARPNFIKAAPLIKELNKLSNVDNLILHTGQHYDKNMSDQFFNDLNIPDPDVNLGLGGGSHATQTAEIMKGCEKVFEEHNPDLVIVYGDVNSCVAATLVASKLHIKIAHIESGLRSGDRTMPEEINRIVTDSLSDYLFVTCEDAVSNLKDTYGKTFFVGNTMIDSLVEFENKFHDEFTHEGEYGLVTIHRPFTVDNKKRLKELMDALVKVSEEQNIELIFPLHPRTRNALIDFDLYETYIDDISFIEPQGYIDFMSFQKHAKFIITDSGGVQEESSYFNVPCLTVRDNTERPVTCTNGTNKMIGTSYANIIDEVMMIDFNKKNKIKLWDGKSANRIVQVLKEVIL
tara:strand:+ start:1151 stop:2212 length:1062 start_codon:yes stop_codon:yes gene_type:complete